MAINIPIITEFNGKGIERARKEFQQLEGVGAKAGFVIKKAMLPATAALGALAVAAKDVIGVASDLGESTAKVGVIFGDGATAVEDFAKQAAKSMGQSRRSVLQAAGTFGTFGKAAGLTGKELATFANDFTALASDLASFNNTTPEDAIQAIGAALRGEAEPMRRYGVLLNDATLKQAAMELGIYDGIGALDAQQKILAAQKVIFEQTSDAQGDFARTGEGLANSQRTIAALIDDTTVAIGDGLLPIVEEVLPFLKDMAEWAADNPDKFKQIAVAIGGIAASVVALNAAMKVSMFFSATGTAGVLGALVAGFATAYATIESYRLGVNREYNRWVGYLEGITNTVVRTINPIIKALNFLSPGNPFAELGLISIPRLNTTPSSQKGLGFGALDQIPAMADGGIVTGPTLAVVGEAGPEVVIPLDRLGSMGAGGGNNVTINVQGGDPNAVVDALRRYMVQNGPIPITVQ